MAVRAHHALGERAGAQARAVLLPACSSGGTMSDHLNITEAIWSRLTGFQAPTLFRVTNKISMEKYPSDPWQETSFWNLNTSRREAIIS
jgi:hypothetical protein